MAAAKEEMLSGFGPWCADLPLAASFELGENSRQGFGRKNAALHLGQTICNSTTALGIERGLLQSRGGSRIQTWNRYAYVLNNPLSNIDPDGLDCVYLNDAGDDVESIDHDSSARECTGNGNGGYWVPGTVANSSWVTDIDQNNGTIGAYSNQNGFLGWTASANNDTGVEWQTVGVDVPNTSVVVNVTSSADDLTPEASTILSLTYLRSMHDLGCWFGVSSGVGQAGAAAYKLGQPVPGSKPFITPGSSLGTSPLSEALHGTMSVNAPIPTPVGGPGTGVPFRFANTSSLGTAAARYAPFAGLAAMGYSVYKLNSCLSSTPSGH